MKLEYTTFYKLKPGDLFFFPTVPQGAQVGVQVRTDAPITNEGNATVVRVVVEREE